MAETATTTTTTIFKNTPTKNRNRAIYIILYFIVFMVSVSAIFFLAKPNSNLKKGTSQNPINQQSLNPIIKTACSSTLYPSLCFSTLSSSPNTTLDRFLEASINRTIDLVSSSQYEITDFFARRVLNLQEKSAFNDCVELLDQTQYELGQSMDEFRKSFGVSRPFYGDLKTLLSAAMTNENTCIDGFSELESRFHHQKQSLRIYLEKKLKPIVQMISNMLAIIKHMEERSKQENRLLLDNNNQPFSSVRGSKTGFPTWMDKRERRLMGRGNYRIKPNVVVASDGSGNYTTIGEAIRMAPNMSFNRFVIKIKAGIYREYIEIPRNKMSIMLFGSGINSTFITGNRSFINGYSTFTSATLGMFLSLFLLSFSSFSCLISQ